MSLSQKVLKGAVWSLIVSWITRIIGIISTIILVRVLAPEDFGIAALATMVMLLFISLCELGIRQYIIKSKDITNDLVNTAWSLQLIINLIIAILMIVFAPIVASFLDNHKLVDVLRVMAFIPIVTSLNNPGGILLAKKMDYATLSKVTIGAKLISAPATVFIALAYKSYWALIFGQLISIILTCLFSYIFISYRPQFRKSNFSYIFTKTKWLLVSSLTGFVRAKIESLIVNIKYGAEGLGLYDISREFAHLPLSDVIGPASAPLLSGVSSIETGMPEVYKAIVKYMYIAVFFLIPSIIGIFLVGDLFVKVVMGSQWLRAIPIFKSISALMIVFNLYTCCRTIMLLADDLRILTILDICSIALMFGLLLPSFIDSLEVLVIVRVLIGIIFGLFLLAILNIRYRLNLKPIIQLFFTVPILCLPFSLVIYLINPFLIAWGDPFALFAMVAIGGILYLGTLYASITFLAKINEYFLFTKELLDNLCKSCKKKVFTLI